MGYTYIYERDIRGLMLLLLFLLFEVPLMRDILRALVSGMYYPAWGRWVSHFAGRDDISRMPGWRLRDRVWFDFCCCR